MPLLVRLNSSALFKHSDKMCPPRSPFLRWIAFFGNVKNLSGGVRHEGGQMRLLRRVDEKERQDLVGAQRWRCAACGASATVRYDDAAARLEEFLSWLLSKGTQLEMPGAGRTFRRRTAEFWEVWPMPVPDGEFHRVLFVDGIRLAERLVVLIRCSEDRVVSWYMAQSENSRAWSALMEPIPAPDVVVTDGGSGFAKAVRAAWPRTKVQRCLFHAYAQVKRCTTTRPKLQAGRELYQIALDLMHIETLHQAELWRERYLDWCGFWADFLEDTTLVDGRRVYTHERLRKARRSLSSLVSAGTLFTYLDPGSRRPARSLRPTTG